MMNVQKLVPGPQGLISKLQDEREPRMPLPSNPGQPKTQACVWAGCWGAELSMERGRAGLWLWVKAQEEGRLSSLTVSENRAQC